MKVKHADELYVLRQRLHLNLKNTGYFLIDLTTGKRTGYDWRCPNCKEKAAFIDNGVTCLNGHVSY